MLGPTTMFPPLLHFHWLLGVNRGWIAPPKDSAHQPLTCWCWFGASQCGAWSNIDNLILRLFLYQFLHSMVSWHHKTATTMQQTAKSNHGGGATCPSSNKDLINKHDLTCGRPSGGVGQGNQIKKMVVQLNQRRNEFISIDLSYFNLICCLPRTMVAEMAFIVTGSRPNHSSNLITYNWICLQINFSLYSLLLLLC